MKTIIRTITVFAILNLGVTDFALAQEVPALAKPAAAPTPPSPPHIETVELAAKNVQKQAEDVRKQLEIVQNLKWPFSRGGIGTVLVIPTSEMKAEDLVTIIEDMTVMARIFDKQLGQEQSRQQWFTLDFFRHDSRMAEAMYLQGYGALFLKKVDFPLSPQTIVQEEKETQKEDVDPVWQQMRQEIYEPQEGRRRREERPEEKYDAEKVENLKTNIIKALKHATNIRCLNPDESVVLTVTGSGDSSTINLKAFTIATEDYERNVKIVTPNLTLTSLPRDLELSCPTILVIRAKKSAIDAFAKGDLDLDQFRKRVQIFTQ